MSASFGPVHAPVGERIELAGRGSSNGRLSSVEIRRGDVRVDTHDQPGRAPLTALHRLVWEELIRPQTFPLELRIEQSTLTVAIDDTERELTVYTLGDHGAAVGTGIEIVGPLAELRRLELRTLTDAELEALLATAAR